MKSNWTTRCIKLCDHIALYREFKRKEPRLLSVDLEIKKSLNKLYKIIELHTKEVGVGEITQNDIDRANEHPIENLFPDAKKGKVLCIFHEEKNPSASIGRHNRFKCFSCGASKSVIDCYQQLHGVGFVEAVKALR